MAVTDADQIRPVEDVIREHVEATIAAYRESVPQWRIAVELGWSPTTLIRRLKKWRADGGESVTRDRR